MSGPPKKRARTSNTPDTAVMEQPVRLAKRGDVILKLGKKDNATLDLLVSSVALSLMSPVFEAMFSGPFIEGQSLSPDSPRTVPLPDDDPEAMRLLCSTAHMCVDELPNKNVPRKIVHTVFAEYAILCDKYDCIGAVSAYSKRWAMELLVFPGRQHFEKLIFSTYVLDLPDEFAKATRAVILDRVDVKFTIAAHVPNVLPLIVFGTYATSHRCFDRCQLISSDKIKAMQQETMNSALKYSIPPNFGWCLMSEEFHDCSKSSFNERNRECQDCSETSVGGVLLRSFYRNELLPPQIRPLSVIRRSVSNLELSEDVDENGGLLVYPPVKDHMLDDLDRLRAITKGLCLDCVKHEVTGDEPLICRVSH